MKKTLVAILLFSSLAQARPEYYQMLVNRVPGGNVPQSCQTCHASGTSGNLFRQDFRKVILGYNLLSNRKLIEMNLEEKWDLLLNKMDSNKNGVVNVKDITNGVNPGLPQ